MTPRIRLNLLVKRDLYLSTRALVIPFWNWIILLTGPVDSHSLNPVYRSHLRENPLSGRERASLFALSGIGLGSCVIVSF
jgi:hypothetical protein